MKQLFKTALGEVNSNKIRTFFMLISIFVGITALMTVISLGQGTQEQIMERLDRMGMVDTFTVRTLGGGMGGGEQSSYEDTRFALSMEDASDLEIAVPGILETIPSTGSRLQVSSTAGILPDVSIQGVTPSFQLVRNWDMEKGMFINSSDIENTERVAVIGQTIARTLFPEVEPVGNTITLGDTNFEIIGLLASRGASGGGRDSDEIVLIPVSTFIRLFENARVNNFTVWVENPEDVEAVALASQNFFDSRYPNDPVIVRVPSLTTGTRQETSANLATYLKIIAVSALLVGGVMIMNIMFLSVSERTWEIGLRKALGAKKSDILKQILLEVLLVSLAGGILGIFGGILTVNLVTAQEIVRRASVSWEAPVLALVFSLTIGVIFGLRPALRAASLDPVEALRSVE